MGVRERWIFIVMANFLTHAFSNEFIYFFMQVYCTWYYRHGKCVAPKCQTGYTSFTGKLSSFHFPPKNEELNKKWNRFVNRSDWVPTKHSVLCKLHFEDICKIKGMSLNWSTKRVPSIHSAELIDTPCGLPSTRTFRQRPRKKIFLEDQLDSFCMHDKINSLGDLNQSHYPPVFEVRQFEGCVIFHRLKFDIVSQVATIIESIRIDKDLHVQLQYNGIPLQLPSWLINGHNAKLDKPSTLENFPTYIRSPAIENQCFTWSIKARKTLQTYG